MSARLRVLIVCDDWEACERYEHELRGVFDVEPVIFASEATERAAEFKPDRVLADLTSQDCTPDEFVELRARTAPLGEVPAVVVGASSASVRTIARPFTYSALIALLRE